MQFIFTRFQSKMPPSQNENIHYNLCTFFLYKIMQWKICLIEIFHCSTYVNTALIIFFFQATMFFESTLFYSIYCIPTVQNNYCYILLTSWLIFSMQRYILYSARGNRKMQEKVHFICSYYPVHITSNCYQC